MVFNRTFYLTTFTPTDAGGDPCILAEGTARLYALDYRTGEAVLNYDTTNDIGSEIVEGSDRSQVIGASIPSALVMAIIQGKPVAYVGIRGGILRPEIGITSALVKIYWRQFD